MTYYGPAPAEPGPPPPGYRPPAGYGPPAHHRPRPGAGVDPKLVHPLDWVAMGIAVLALVFSFFAYYTYDATAAETRAECAQPSGVPSEARGLLGDLCGGTSAGAWHGFFGWFGVLLALVAAGLVAVAAFSLRGRPTGRTRRLALGAAALGLLSTLVALVAVPDWPALQDFANSVGGSYSSSQYHKDIADGHGFSYWLILIMLAALTALTLLRNRQVAAVRPAPPPWAGSPTAPPPAPPPFPEGWAPPPPPSASGEPPGPWNRP